MVWQKGGQGFIQASEQRGDEGRKDRHLLAGFQVHGRTVHRQDLKNKCRFKDPGKVGYKKCLSGSQVIKCDTGRGSQNW